ncbi:MAG: cation transporter [Deltaproteobacteria bacterium]|nr:cation transporter [Deltaproteobacteria bacterium]MBI3293844.1 cation transporter [Deltaproteobacteria bacterium]
MGHGHEHCDHKGNWESRALKIVFFLTVIYMIAEVVGGIMSGSLSLIADAGHMATDAASLLLSLFASWVATKPADKEKTYGYYRAEILAALVNGAALIGITGWILYEAWVRLKAPLAINAPVMGAVALGGLVVNLVSLRFLHGAQGHSHGNLNLHGVWLHVASDALGSISAMIAAFLVWQFNWVWADAVTSVLISALILVGSVRLVTHCVDVLLESVPRGLVLDDIRKEIGSVRQVCEVHDLHVWSMTNGVHAMSAHVCVEESADHAGILRQITELLNTRFGIDHATVQLEPPSFVHSPLHL